MTESDAVTVLRHCIDCGDNLDLCYMEELSHCRVDWTWFADFDADRNRFDEDSDYAVLYKSIKTFYLEYGSIPTYNILLEALDESDLPPVKVDSLRRRLKDIKRASVARAEFDYALSRLRMNYIKSYGVKAALQFVDAVEIDPESALIDLQRRTEKALVSTKRSRSGSDRSKWLSELVIEHKASLTGETSILAKTIPYPYPSFNARLGGMRRGELIVVAAPYSAGKSFVVHDVAYNAAMSGYRVVIAELEMLFEQTVVRYAARLVGLPIMKIQLGALTPAEKAALSAAIDVVEQRVDKGNVLFVPPQLSKTPSTLQREIDRHFGKDKPDLVLVDYMTEMRPSDPSLSSWEAVLAICQELKQDIAMGNDAVCLSVVHLNKSNSTQYQSIDQRADLVFHMTQDPDDPYIPPEDGEWVGTPGTLVLKVIRNRNGPKNLEFRLKAEFATASIKQEDSLRTAIGRAMKNGKA